MSLDPGFTIFFVLVLIVFIVKMLCLVDFFVILFVPSTSTIASTTIGYIIQGLGSATIGVSFAIVAIEIYVLTSNFMAVLIHPFVIDFLLFLICNILSYFIIGTVSVSSPEYVYVAVPQVQKEKLVEMKEIVKEEPKKEEPKKEAEKKPAEPAKVEVPVKVELPVQPVAPAKPETPKKEAEKAPMMEMPVFPQLPIQIPIQYMPRRQPQEMQMQMMQPMEPQQYPSMPMQFFQQQQPFNMMPREQMQFVEMPQPQFTERPTSMPIQPTPPPMMHQFPEMMRMAERPKAMTFVPYYMPN